MEEQNITQPQTPAKRGKNGLGLAGFIIAIIGAVFSWVPVLGIILVVVAFILCLIALIIGIAKKKNIIFAIIGLVLTVGGLIVSIIIMVGIAGAAADLGNIPLN
jgi:hypothetical protein